MTENISAKIYEDILRRLSATIERYFQPCGLENTLKTILHNLASRAADENWTGYGIIISGVKKTVKQAQFLAERYNNHLCHYLNLALRRGWIENWVLRFRERMIQ